MNGVRSKAPTRSLSRNRTRFVFSLATLLLFGGLTELWAERFVPPRLTRPVEPEYPQGLHDAGVEGQVEAVFRVDRRGVVQDPKVEFATHPDFGEAVKKVVERWRFSPARRNGSPVNQRVRMPVLFTIKSDDPLSKWAGRNVFRTLPQDPVKADDLNEWPEPTAWIEPFYPDKLNGTGKREEIVVGFVVDEHGDVVNPEILVGDDPQFIASALVATLSLEFSPHITEEGPVPVTMAVSYQFDEKKQHQWDEVAERTGSRRR